MAEIIKTAIDEAREALLNDPTGAIYKDSKMVPIARKVYRELQTKVSALGVGAVKEISTVVSVLAGTVRLGDGEGLPVDLLYPVKLGERAAGSSDVFRAMAEEDWEPDITLGTFLTFWVWREDEIKFPGSTTDREVQIRYIRSLGSIDSILSPILITGATGWIAQRIAAIASLTIGANGSRSTALMDDLNREGGLWDDLKITLVKRKQGIPVRRRRTRYRPL